MDYYQREIEATLISCIVSRKGGVPFQELNDDYRSLTGHSIPFLSFGFPNLKSFVASIKDIYFIKDRNRNDILIVHNDRTKHIRKLIENQKSDTIKRKRESSEFNLANGFRCSSQFSIYSYKSTSSSKKVCLLQPNALDYLKPMIYDHQLIGDDIFLDLAEYSLMVTMSKTAPKRCGLCISGQTISDLVDNIYLQPMFPQHLVILIGMSDLLNGKTSDQMIDDMECLISYLQSNNLQVTFCTIPQLMCIPLGSLSSLRIFNDFIRLLEFRSDLFTVLDLNEYLTMHFRKNNFSKYSKFLLNDYERRTLLSGLQELTLNV